SERGTRVDARRFKKKREKMKPRDILRLSEVVRTLSVGDREKGLSTGEKQMFVKAKKILASELMYAKDMDEEATAEWLDGVLAGANGSSNGAAAPKKKPPAPKTTVSKAPAKKPAAKSTTAAKKPPAAKKKATAGAR